MNYQFLTVFNISNNCRGQTRHTNFFIFADFSQGIINYRFPKFQKIWPKFNFTWFLCEVLCFFWTSKEKCYFYIHQSQTDIWQHSYWLMMF